VLVTTPYFKPSKNKTERCPDCCLHETNEWLVFPHELAGLTLSEIKQNKPELSNLFENISEFI